MTKNKSQSAKEQKSIMDYSKFFFQVLMKTNTNENRIFQKADESDIEYLKSSKYPDCIVQFYSHMEPRDCVEINGVRLEPINSLQTENEAGVPVYVIYDLGYRAVGSTEYGDVFCLNINDAQQFIYIASHEEIEDGEDYTNDEVLSKIIKVADSFEEFLEKFVKGELPSIYGDENGLSRAVEDFTQPIQIEPKDAPAYNRRGLVHYYGGDFAQAIKDYTRAVRLDPKNADAYFNRGLVYYDKGDYARAIEDFTLVIKIDPDYNDVYFKRGLAYYDKGDYALALEDYTKEIQINPTWTSYNNRAIVYCRKGDYDRAINDHTKALRIYPNNSVVYECRGFTHMDNRNFKKAIADFTKAIQISPGSITYINRGACYSNIEDDKNENKNTQKAISDYMEAVRLNPDFDEKDIPVHYNLGVAYSKTGESEKSIAEYTESIRLNPKVSTYNNRGAGYLDKGEFDKAVKDFNKAIKLENYHMAYQNRGQVFWLRGELDKAIADYTEAIRLLPDKLSFNTSPDIESWCYAKRGLAYFDKGNIKKAAADQAKALRLKPNLLKEAVKGSDKSYKKGGMYDVITDYSIAIWLNPGSAELYIKRGNVYERADDITSAAKDWKTALELEPDNALAKKKLKAIQK